MTRVVGVDRSEIEHRMPLLGGQVSLQVDRGGVVTSHHVLTCPNRPRREAEHLDSALSVCSPHRMAYTRLLP